MHFYSDNSLAKQVLNWEPKIDIDHGLKETIEWYSKMYKEGKLEKWMIKKR